MAAALRYRVFLPRRNKSGVICEVKHQPETPAPALACREDGSSSWGMTELKEQYLYKIDGEGIPSHWFAEKIIQFEERNV